MWHNNRHCFLQHLPLIRSGKRYQTSMGAATGDRTRPAEFEGLHEILSPFGHEVRAVCSSGRGLRARRPTCSGERGHEHLQLFALVGSLNANVAVVRHKDKDQVCFLSARVPAANGCQLSLRLYQRSLPSWLVRNEPRLRDNSFRPGFFLAG